MVFLRPTIVRDALRRHDHGDDRYDAMRAMQQNIQPSTDNPMLNSVRGAPVLPPLSDTVRATVAPHRGQRA
jgi:general secretion pathway protein D